MSATKSSSASTDANKSDGPDLSDAFYKLATGAMVVLALLNIFGITNMHWLWLFAPIPVAFFLSFFLTTVIDIYAALRNQVRDSTK